MSTRRRTPGFLTPSPGAETSRRDFALPSWILALALVTVAIELVESPLAAAGFPATVTYESDIVDADGLPLSGKKQRELSTTVEKLQTIRNLSKKPDWNRRYGR